MTEPPDTHLRPFFPSAADFAAATAIHFQFLLEDFGYLGPQVTDQGQSFEIQYDGERASVLLSWDAEGGYFGCHLIARLPSGGLESDPDHWLTPNEVLAARDAQHEWVTQGDLEHVDEPGFGRAMERIAANLRNHCGELLRGDWSIYGVARGRLAAEPDG
jgi:hypothetical protein